MKLDKFQKKVKGITNPPPMPVPGLLSSMWLAEEAAEVMKEYRTAVFHNAPVDLKYVYEEMGDTLVCLARLANDLNLSLDQIAESSLEKLQEKVDNRDDKTIDNA